MKNKSSTTVADNEVNQDLVNFLNKAELPEKYQMAVSDAMTICKMDEDKFCRMNAAYTLGYYKGIESCMAGFGGNSSHNAISSDTSINDQAPINEVARQSIIEALSDFEESSVELERAMHCMEIFLDVALRETVSFAPSEGRETMLGVFLKRYQETISLTELISRQLNVVNDTMQNGFCKFYDCMETVKEDQAKFNANK